jgi:hypothetical protein
MRYLGAERNWNADPNVSNQGEECLTLSSHPADLDGNENATETITNGNDEEMEGNEP